MTTVLVDRNLEEQIFQLQKVDLDLPVRQVVDEAAQLLAQGRHLEAGALVEKAEAMRTTTAGAQQQPVQPQTQASEDQARSEARAEAVARLASDLASGIAEGIARAVSGSIQELEEHLLGETRRFSSSLDQKLATLQATVEALLSVRDQIDQLTETVSQQRAEGVNVAQKCEQLTAATASLQDTDVRHEAEITALRDQTQELSASVSGRIESLSTQLELQQEQLSGLKSTVADLAPSVINLVERLDRQASVIRSLHDAQTQREIALEQLIEALARLKTSHLPAAMAAGQL